MISILIPSWLKISNICAATPGCPNIPAPIMETLAIFSSILTASISTAFCNSSNTSRANTTSSIATVKIRSVFGSPTERID